jgi:hypothetical protein
LILWCPPSSVFISWFLPTFRFRLEFRTQCAGFLCIWRKRMDCDLRRPRMVLNVVSVLKLLVTMYHLKTIAIIALHLHSLTVQ